MTGRELLELAAKAAGILGEYKEMSLAHGVVTGISSAGHRLWDPLTNDGDALRLAVNLGILDMHKILDGFIREEQRFHDRATATRRAIVRVAAEIGKTRLTHLTPSNIIPSQEK